MQAEIENLKAVNESLLKDRAPSDKSDQKFSPDDKPPFKVKENYLHFVGRFNKEFPIFQARKVENDIFAWEKYWDSIAHFQKITSCSDLIVSYMIKDTAHHCQELATSLSPSHQRSSFKGTYLLP